MKYSTAEEIFLIKNQIISNKVDIDILKDNINRCDKEIERLSFSINEYLAKENKRYDASESWFEFDIRRRLDAIGGKVSAINDIERLKSINKELNKLLKTLEYV